MSKVVPYYAMNLHRQEVVCVIQALEKLREVTPAAEWRECYLRHDETLERFNKILSRMNEGGDVT